VKQFYRKYFERCKKLCNTNNITTLKKNDCLSHSMGITTPYISTVKVRDLKVVTSHYVLSFGRLSLKTTKYYHKCYHLIIKCVLTIVATEYGAT
jgi:hypothetical protein